MADKMADNMADTKPLDCKIIIKNPVLLKIGDGRNDFRSGVSVIDIIFPGNNNVEVGKLSFKNSYTASITVKLKILDLLGSERWKTAIKNYTLMPHPHFETGSQDCFMLFTCANQVSTLYNIRLPVLESLLMFNADLLGSERWKTAIKNYTLMPHPHFETGSQDCFMLFTCANQTDEPPPQVIMLRLILRQPSPHWSNFSIDEIKCFPHSTVSSPLLKRCLQNNDCYDPFGIKSPQNRPNSAGVASNIQELWAMTQEVKTSKQRATVGRFDVDRSYDINLLSYT
ncbi:nicolin-1-like [Orbicella faveolata]|uniref:nicolin-1-like n=1 Tax=Orbicella faveolata TaxID=48498 RepID=UPI0009E5847D|nr:nicolin-1-like [Orbicella faveolata]